MTVPPDGFARRSPLYRLFVAAGAQFVAWGDAAVAMHCDDDRVRERERLQRLGLVDLSVLPRTGFKGPGAPDWLATQRLRLPDAPNRAAPQPDGGLLARLGVEEHLLLAPPDGAAAAVAGLDRACAEAEPAGVYDLPRRDSHAWLRVVGVAAPALFAKLCAVDLRPAAFAMHDVAQTQVAAISAIIIRADCGTIPAYHLLFDSASAVYLWDCLVDAAEEFGGGPAGLAALLEQDAPGG